MYNQRFSWQIANKRNLPMTVLCGEPSWLRIRGSFQYNWLYLLSGLDCLRVLFSLCLLILVVLWNATSYC